MWTPKRVLLVVLGLGLFVGCYTVYAGQLGNIDGLPPLPPEYWPDNKDPQPLKDRPLPAVNKKLEVAFGRECPELKLPIKIEVPARGIVLASKDVIPEPDGRVRLEPLSIALFGKRKGEDGTPEVNTIRAAIAFLTFEQPVHNVADMGKYRITAAQIERDIHIVNNRHTLARDDDISVDVSKGPLFYDAATQKVWSDDFVHIEDMQSKPRPTQVSGQGFVLELLTEQPKGKKPSRQPARHSDAINGVRTALLKGAVDMHLYVDGKSGFLSPAPKPGDKAPAADPKKPPEKSHLIVKTQGPFHYDLVKDFATFDVPPAKTDRPSAFPEHVLVTRADDALGNLDHLVCEHLELQFRKKGEPKSAVKPAAPAKPKKKDAPDQPGSSREIDWAHATGKSVILTSDIEHLEAHGHDLFYDARTLTTTLKGKPMWAIKEGNEIQAEQLELTNLKEGQSARAKGPGTLSLFDKTTGKRPMKARWNQLLTSSKDGDLDLLRLTGKASFIDDENDQELHADDLSVWLHPQEKSPSKAVGTKPATVQQGQPSASRSRRPHHLIATGTVRTKSKEFNIKDSQRFVVWFADAPPGKPVAPAASKPAPAASKPTATATAAPKPAARPAEPKAEEKQPIDLWARAVEAHVLRVNDKSQLQKMRSEGSVHVVQKPSRPGEKGADIKGDTLNLTARPEGNYLVVTGDLARLDTDKMLILGPEVNIDQVENKAWVNGIGAMTIESETDFQGNKLKKPTPLTIHWNQAMLFSGQNAVFHGGIQADQNNARLTCQELHVVFDKPISLRENQKERDKAKVSKLTCDKAAIVEDSLLENGKEVKYQQLKSPAIVYDNDDGRMQASGPGELRLMQKGDVEAAPAGNVKVAAVPAKNKKDEEMKLTFISFLARMDASKKSNIAKFYTDVRVLHMPGDNPRIDIDLAKIVGGKLPPGAMYIRCDQLKVMTRQNPSGGKAWQVMHATGRVFVASPEFSGKANSVSYDEEKDQVIFDGGSGGTATLYKIERQGGRPQTIEGEQIIYSRRDGKHTGTKIRNIEGH